SGGRIAIHMYNDMRLLGGIAAAIAVALTIALIARGERLEVVRNPLASWHWIAVTALVVVSAIATRASWDAIKKNDVGLGQTSGAVQWAYTSKGVAETMARYTDRAQAIRGVMIDSIAFIPSYVLLLASFAFAVAKYTGQPWLVIAGWLVPLAGALDYLENAGIYLALGNVTTAVAPLTYAASQLKWLIVFTVPLFTLFAGLAAPLARLLHR
ncbi:MAG TPA: hypothetical protein VFN10_18410, partial [Thermoanaerobaculia bacterium]|nr:hypothetical protein [Thermoanaerobaculia bacterium]